MKPFKLLAAAWLRAVAERLEPSRPQPQPIEIDWQRYPLLSRADRQECLAAGRAHVEKLAASVHQLEAIDRIGLGKYPELMARPNQA